VTSFYLDSSAALKLIVTEGGTAALRAWAERTRPEFIACDLVRTEVLRACRRHSTDATGRGRGVLEAITLFPVSTDLYLSAAFLDPAGLRTLDAIHLAAALSLGDDISGVVTYDERLAGACAEHGLAILAPA
jgi:hypothetical protein